MGNIIAIVGRPNVGKSTLFNRLIEARKAIMDDMSGVTRDRHYGYGDWSGHNFTVIDTGGYVVGSEDVFEGAIRKQVSMAISEASVVLFMVDVIDGLNPLDEEFAQILRSINKPVIIVANKSDTYSKSMNATEFYSLGFDHMFTISAANGSGTGEMLDEVIKSFKTEQEEDPDEGIPRISILGRPNVGKSSFLNVLVGEDRQIVTEIAGTTRDSIDTHYNMYGKNLILTDTAGIRRKSRVKDKIEFYSVMRSIDTLQNSDVSIIMIDAQSGIESQDMNLISLATKYKKGILIMVNKWDLVEKDHKTHDDYKKDLLQKIAPFNYIPVVFTSVINKKRINQVLELGVKIYNERQKKVSTSKLNEALLPEIEKYPPPAVKGKHIKIKYITQLPTKTPTFAFFCNLPQYIKSAYERYLENKLRHHFGFEGVPVTLVFRKK